MCALIRQFCRQPEVCDGIASDEMSEGNLDQYFKLEVINYYAL